MTTPAVISPKKLIEVALPLDAINVSAAREKSIRHGHPSTLHLWWARRPLAAARAVIFGQLVHDPEDLWRCQNPGKEPNQQVRGHWTKARGKLFRIIEELVLWEKTTHEGVLDAAREAIRESWIQTCELNKDHPKAKDLFNPNRMPALHDPFAGGGTIPLEAQRLGLEAYASDLNPVAVLINKAMIEIPPKFAARPPVHPDAQNPLATWKSADGLAEDVRRYGKWVRDEADRRVGHIYPRVEVTGEMAQGRPDIKQYVGQKLTVIAWIWARTVKSPNPAHSDSKVPLTSTFVLCSKKGKGVYVDPIIGGGSYRFTVKVGIPPSTAKSGTKSSRANFNCLISQVPISGDYIKAEGKAGRLGVRLMAIVAQGQRARVYLSPVPEHEAIALASVPSWRPELKISGTSQYLGVKPYGMDRFDQVFTRRQLTVLVTLSDLVSEASEKARRDAIGAGLADDDIALNDGGAGARAYGEALAVYLSFTISKCADRGSTLGRWDHTPTQSGIINTFSRQALSMTWDFAESNPLGKASGSFVGSCELVAKSLRAAPATSAGHAEQADAASQQWSSLRFVSTDPPYYDNVPYADLSDYFYVWLRRSLKSVYPNLFATIAVPKCEELVAFAYRHESKDGAEKFFLRGMTEAMQCIADQAHPAAPITVYYAFKQSDTKSDGTNSTGWETFLEAVIASGLSIGGTWPMRTELGNRMRGMGSNALASSIVLVCRRKASNAGTISRRKFVRQLNEVLPVALDIMTRESEGLPSPVAPVDLSQAIIGPGMAIFSRYDAVVEADGSPMSVKTALQLINRFLAEDDFDADTQFCLHWFDQQGWDQGKFGEADTLARAKGTSVDGVRQAGVIEAAAGKVRLLRWRDYPPGWDPATDARLPIWEALHQLIRAFKTEGDSGAARVMVATARTAEAARQLAYRLYTLCERKGWAEDARAYNDVVTGWSGIEHAAAQIEGEEQGLLWNPEES